MGHAQGPESKPRDSHHWTDSPEPHALRRKVILQKYGEQVRGRGAACGGPSRALTPQRACPRGTGSQGPLCSPPHAGATPLQIRPLMGYEPWTVVPVALVGVAQTLVALAIGLYDVPWWAVMLLSYLVSPMLAGSLMAAHHEITHYLVRGAGGGAGGSGFIRAAMCSRLACTIVRRSLARTAPTGTARWR